MRRNLPVTQRNIPVRQGANILSTTNPKGQITHINEEFIDISGFSRDELLGEPHNIIRHPDMPRAAYEEMWRRLKEGKSWLGAVKNRCKNGDHYWVQAYAIPIVGKNGELTELQSIRSQLDDKAGERAEALYRKLRQAEPDKGPLPATKVNRSLPLPLQLSLLFAVIIGGQAAALPYLEGWFALAVASLAAMAVGVAGVHWLMAPFRKCVLRSRGIIDDLVAEHIFTGRTDDIGSIDLAMTQQGAELDAVVKRLHDVIDSLSGLAEETIKKNSGAHGAVKEQSVATKPLPPQVRKCRRRRERSRRMHPACWIRSNRRARAWPRDRILRKVPDRA